VTTYNGHKKSVKAIDVYIPSNTLADAQSASPNVYLNEMDEVLIVTGCGAGQIRVWLADTGVLHSLLEYGDRGAIQCLQVVNAAKSLLR
jgi:hypothetical protein